MAGSARSTPAPLSHADVRSIKARLFTALGKHSDTYWTAFGALCTASIDRREFHARVEHILSPECYPLHNALVLSMLSAAYARQTSARLRHGTGHRHAPLSPIQAAAHGLYALDSDSDTDADPAVGGLDTRSLKRLRHMYAGLSQDERARLKQLPKTSHGGVHTAATVWAGAGAELLEKKRKEDEKRKAIEERRRTREIKSSIGALSWRATTVQAAAHADAQRPQLSSATQEAFMRGIVAPQCSEAHELPDVHLLQDRMSLAAVEAGLSGGVQVQAAAVVLAALQDHLRNVISTVLRSVRSQRADQVSDKPPRLRMSDMATLLELAPHVVVEPLGQGPTERLLVPDEAAQYTHAPHPMALFARQCAVTTLGAAPPGTAPEPSASEEDPERQFRERQQQHRDVVRNQVLLDQLAPLRMLDRPALCESMANGEVQWSPQHVQAAMEGPDALGTALVQHYQSSHASNHHHHHPNPAHRHKDEYFDVVDPMALLGKLCE